MQCRDFPIAERDAEGNTWQHRPLHDGSVHRVLKNFPSERELVAMLAGTGVPERYEQLENFGLFEYRVRCD